MRHHSDKQGRHVRLEMMASRFHAKKKNIQQQQQQKAVCK